MISGVLFLLLGEAALLGSWPLLVWFAAVAGVNAVYLPLVEEPGLARRYGADYERYREHVPRWVPRIRGWEAAQPPP
jgi:protein-S-isoprenylcysteine O-methyltransferase Ste14